MDNFSPGYKTHASVWTYERSAWTSIGRGGGDGSNLYVTQHFFGQLGRPTFTTFRTISAQNRPLDVCGRPLASNFWRQTSNGRQMDVNGRFRRPLFFFVYNEVCAAWTSNGRPTDAGEQMTFAPRIYMWHNNICARAAPASAVYGRQMDVQRPFSPKKVTSRYITTIYIVIIYSYYMYSYYI